MQFSVGTLSVKIDAEDWPVVGCFNWRADKKGYIITTSSYNFRKKHMLLHRHIMNAPEGVEVDHINGDRSDNRKQNLRLCSRKENLANTNGHPGKRGRTSKFKGVSLHKKTGLWRARVENDSCGYFKTEQEAADAYDRIAKGRFGRFFKGNGAA